MILKRFSILVAGAVLSVNALSTVTAGATAVIPKMNGKIAYTNSTPSKDELWIRSGDGSNPVKVYECSGLMGSPTWSPNGKQLLFDSACLTSNYADIFRINIDGSGLTNLTNTPTTREEAPTWSPDGTKVAYLSDATRSIAEYRLWIMNPDGTSKTDVSQSQSQMDLFASWSPDSKKIYYSSQRSGVTNLHVYNMTNQTTSQYTAFPGTTYAPSVSPDGSKIVFAHVGSGDSKVQVYVQNVDGTNLHKPYQACTDQSSQWPAWSSDGKKITYTTECGSPDQSILHMMLADGTSPHAITPSTDDNWGIHAWQRLPVNSTVDNSDGTTTNTVDDDNSDIDYDVDQKIVLVVNGKVGQVNVNSNGVLKGHGTIVLGVTVKPGGKLAPGESPGCINSGGLTLTSGSTYEAEIAGTTVCTQYDQTNVTGAVDLGGATLSTLLLNNFTGKQGDTFTIVNNDGVDAIVGTFSGLAEGASITVGGTIFRISYVGGDGNDVVLTITNNPPSVGVPNTGMKLLTSSTSLTLAATIISASGLLVLARRYGSA